MSLDNIYVCCDDGSVFGTDFIQGDGWELSLTDHSYGTDDLWIRCEPGANGGPNQKPRPLIGPQSVINRFLLPIKDFKFQGHRKTGFGQRAVYSVEFVPGKPFSRSLFPAEQQSKLLKNLGTGTYFGSTIQLMTQIAEAKQSINQTC